MMHRPHHRTPILHRLNTRSEAGFSLVELLIAMTLGLILIGGMIAVFAGNKRSSELGTAMANIQESARFALDAIARDGRMSGFQGCIDVNRGAMAVQARTSPTNDLRASASAGSRVVSNTQWDPVPPTGLTLPLSPTPVVGTHSLTLQFGGSDIARLTDQINIGGIPSRAGPVSIDRDLELASDDLAIISDCETADLFRISSVSTNAGGSVLTHLPTHNISANLTRAYGDPRNFSQTTVKQFFSNVYYVGDTGLTNDSGDAITALYQQSLPYGDANNPPVELVQGVENMRVAFGIREASGTLTYVPPESPAFDPARVESIQVGLLMTSWDRITDADDTTTYVLAGQPIVASATSSNGTTHAADRRFRIAFNTTIKIRNRRDDT